MGLSRWHHSADGAIASSASMFLCLVITLVLVRDGHCFAISTTLSRSGRILKQQEKFGRGFTDALSPSSPSLTCRKGGRAPRMSASSPDGLSLSAAAKALGDLTASVQSGLEGQLTALSSTARSGISSLPEIHLPELNLPQQSLQLQSTLDLFSPGHLSEMLASLLLPTIEISNNPLGNLHVPTLSTFDFEYLKNGPSGLMSQDQLVLQRLSALAAKALDAVVAANPALAAPLGHLQSSLQHSLAAVEQAYAAGATLIPAQYHAAVAIAAVGAVSTAIGMSWASAGEASRIEKAAGPSTGRDIPLPTKYDLPAIMEYYNQRPFTLLSRLSAVSYRLGSLAAKLWLDRKVGDGSAWERNMQSRAEEFLEFVQGAGPAFIKIGQGVSIRPDILPEPYLRELVKLQDRVKPFNSGDSRDILTKQLGRPLSEIFLDADTAFEIPVAAASLGQVYRATLRTGEEVAVKVQRPDVLESVTLDLYVIRLLLLILSKSRNIRDSALSILGVIDNWADRFLQELDYIQEAANGDRFRAEMAMSKTLGEAIIVPRVFMSLTTRYVLVTQWVEGVKVNAIDATTPGGRERLKKIVATLLNSYLAQLLESGFLHADPHPGNFLCTPDGRLCVLDMGLMTEVAEDQRYALLEYVSHLTAKDYEATLNDLIVLGFIPREIGDDPEKAAIVAPLLGTVLEQLSNGGGAKSVSVESVGEEVEELGRQYPIVIPAYFGLIIRAFSALEGLGLQLDPQYSIVNECFPYLARRLLTEDSERMHKMLRTFLYGKDGRYLQVDRVDDIVEGYVQFTALADEASKGVAVEGVRDPLGRSTFPPPMPAARDHTASPVFGNGAAPLTPASPSSRRLRRRREGVASGQTSPVFASSGGLRAAADRTGIVRGGNAGGGGGGERRSMMTSSDPIVQDPVARDALKLLFAKEGNYVQELVVEELVRMTDALSREANLAVIKALRALSEAPLSPARIAKALVEAPLNPLLAPLQVPVKVQAFALSRVFNRLEIALELTQEDQESLKALRRLQQLLQGGIGEGGTSQNGDARSTSPLPAGFPQLGFPLLSGGIGRGQREGGTAGVMGPREAIDTARQLAALASLIGPGVVAIVQKFLVQLSARTLDRLADSFDDQTKVSEAAGAAAASRGRFYDDIDAPRR